MGTFKSEGIHLENALYAFIPHSSRQPYTSGGLSPFTVREAGSERLHAQCHRAEEPGFEPLLRGEAVLALLSCELRELAVGGFPPKGWTVGRSLPAGTPGPGNPALHG